MANQANEKEVGIVTSKDNVAVDVAPIEKRESCDSDCPAGEVAWKPGFRAQFPWSGAICLTAVILCSVGAVLVLVTSDKKSTLQWDKRIGPNVLLSILNNIASICITLAVGQGIAIAWWRKALKGATIKELHHSWNFGSSLKAVFLKYKYFNTVALAALMTKFAVIDGVLFQRSTTTYVALSSPHNVSLVTYPTDEFPITSTLRVTNDSTTVRIMEEYYSWDMWYWINSPKGRFDSLYGLQGCKGVCEVKVPALGFAASCSNTTQYVDLVADAYTRLNESAPDQVSQTDLYGANFTMMFPTTEKNYSWIQLTSRSYANQDFNEENATNICPAMFTYHTCELRPALVQYPLVIQFVNTSTTDKDARDSKTNFMFGSLSKSGIPDTDNLYNFDSSTMKQLEGFEFLRYIDVREEEVDEAVSSMAGIVQTLNQYYGSRAWLLTHTGSREGLWDISTEGQWASVAQHTDIEVARNETCPFAYSDPVTDVLTGLNTLMFTVSDNYQHRAAYDATDDSVTDVNDPRNWDNFLASISKTEIGQERLDVVYYQSNWKYMAGALASTLVCILCILPAYWGFWQLGRKVTLGPFEIAHAFQAPVLANVHRGNGHADEVLKAAGKSRVKYTEFQDESVGRNYRFDAH